MRLSKSMCYWIITFIAVLICSNSTEAYTISSFPYHEDFNDRGWETTIKQENPQLCNVIHSEQGGWNNSGSTKIVFNGCGDLSQATGSSSNYPCWDKSGVGAIYFPDNIRPRRINIRWLQYFGGDYESNIYPAETKTLIVRRSNSDFSGNGDSSQRAIVLEYFDRLGNYRYPAICENIGCGNDPSGNREHNKEQFRIADFSEQWVSFEVELDLDTSTYKLFIDTQDGRQSSQNGTMPYDQKSINDNRYWWKSIDILSAFWAPTIASPNMYVMIDELTIDTTYIGVPDGFGNQDQGSNTDPDPDPPDQGLPPNNTADNGLPWESNFETGNFDEWMGTRSQSPGDLSIVTSGANNSNYCARSTLSQGTLSDNYADFYFGDHVRTAKDKVEEVYLRFYSKFDSGYLWPNDSHKIAIFNLTDGVSSQRRYQVYVYVTPRGEYKITHSYIDTWQFMGLEQNMGAPALVRFDEWDKIKLYVRLNTPGASDGVVKLWINGVQKMEHTDVNIRQVTNFGINKLILSSWVADTTEVNGYQYYDDWIVSTEDPDNGEIVAPLEPPGTPPGAARIVL